MTTPETRLERLETAKEDYRVRIAILEEFKERIQRRDGIVLGAAVIQTLAVVSGIIIFLVQKVFK